MVEFRKGRTAAKLLATATAGISAAKIDNPTTCEEPVRYRKHGQILLATGKSANRKLFAQR